MGDSIWKKWPSGPFYIIYWFGCLKSPRWWLGWQNARGHGDVEIWCGSNRRPLSNIPLHCICNHILISLIMISWHSQMIRLVMKYLHLIRNDTSFNKSPKLWSFPLTNTVLELQHGWRLFYWNKNRGLRVEFVISKTSSVFCVQCGRIADGKRSNVTVVRILFPVRAPLNKVVLSSLKLRASHDLMSLHDRRGGLMGLVGAW